MKKEGSVYLLLLWSASTLGVLVFIFANSLMPAAVSAGQSQEVFGILKRLLAFFPFLTHAFVRKLAHALEYALLGAHFAVLTRLLSEKPLAVRVCASLSGLLFAPLDEAVQYFVPGRSASIPDVLIDAAGYLFGLCFLLVGFLAWASIREKGGKNANKTAK